MTDRGSKDDNVRDLRSLTKRRSEKLNEGIEPMPAAYRAPKQELLIEEPPPPQLIVPPMTSPARARAHVAVPAAEPTPTPGTFRRPRFKQKERTDIPRQTYYVDAERHQLLQYWGLLDGRSISEIVRDAIDMWMQSREQIAASEGE